MVDCKVLEPGTAVADCNVHVDCKEAECGLQGGGLEGGGGGLQRGGGLQGGGR